jgi:hypothetical protein
MMRMKLALFGLLLLLVNPAATWATDQWASGKTADGSSVSYLLTTTGSQTATYAVILMPGGNGIMSPGSGNFLIRSRTLFAEGPFIAASTDATNKPDRIMAIVGDLQRRYPGVKVYVVGTSRSTGATLALVRPLDGKVAGFVHTSSMNGISSLDPRGLKSRNLIVLHKKDTCQVTNPSNGIASNRSYGTDLIEMEGGISTGDECEALSYHGYNGIERETVDKIKQWIMAGG